MCQMFDDAKVQTPAHPSKYLGYTAWLCDEWRKKWDEWQKRDEMQK